MKRLLALCVCAVAFSVVSNGQIPVPREVAKGYATLQEPALRSDLAYVSSDALAGRMSLQPGDETAVQWIAQQFAKAGLRPAATDANGKPSFLQAITLVAVSYTHLDVYKRQFLRCVSGNWGAWRREQRVWDLWG